jgi:hypothetical protein
VELVLIVMGVVVVLAGACGLAAVIAAGESERMRPSSRFERAATWQAGYAAADLYVLAGMAAVARVELGAREIEVVLTHVDGSGDGVVITGSRLPPGRLASRVARGEGLAGRALLAGRPMFGCGEPAALGVPIVSGGVVVGAVTAVAEAHGSFGTWHVLRLRALAAEAGRHLGPRAVVSGAQRDAG